MSLWCFSLLGLVFAILAAISIAHLELREQVHILNKEVARLKQQLDRTNSRIDSLAGTLDSKLKALAEKGERLDTNIQSQAERIDRTNSRVDTLTETLDIQVRELTETAERLDTDIRSNGKRLNGTNSRVDTLTETLDIQVRELTETAERLDTDIRSNGKRLERAETTVSFHAWRDRRIQVKANGTIVLDQIHSNVGEAYDTETGVFTAPFAGTYVFLANIRIRNLHVHLLVDNVKTAEAFVGDNELVSLHAIVHLSAGQKVRLDMVSEWIGLTFSGQYNTFMGFLIQAD